MYRTFEVNQIKSMNLDHKYGSGWISNANSLTNEKIQYKLYATGDADLSGRKYIALPSNQKLTQADYQKYNIIK